jgi:outer membrane protein
MFARVFQPNQLKKMKTKLLISLFTLLFSTALLAQEQKFAFVNSDSVLVSMPAYKVQMKMLESYAKQLQTQLNTKRTSLQQKVQDYQTNAPDWAPAVIKEKQQEINDLDAEINAFPQTYQFSVQRKQQELLTPLIEEVQESISVLAKEEGINFVFTDKTLLFSQEQLDLTAKVITKVTTP